MADNIRDKIAGLLALSESPNEHEAKAALLKARELMVKYKLRPEECVKKEKVTVIRQNVDVSCTAMTNPWVVELSVVIAEHYCCRAFRTRYKGMKQNQIGFVGLEDDFEVCKRIFLYAYECVMSDLKREIERYPWDQPGDYRRRCNAYGWGFAAGVKKAFQEQDEEHQEWGLVLVVPKAVDDSMGDMGKGSSLGKVEDGESALKWRGYQEGRKFDPSDKLTGAPDRAALAGG